MKIPVNESSLFTIIAVNEFLSIFKRLTKDQQSRIEKIKNQLKINPFVGKPLGSKWFREKKINGFRLFYLIYEKQRIVALISFSDKKLQQQTINAIRLRFEYYREEVLKLSPSV